MGTRTIRRTWKVDGVLTDVTTAKLSDATGAYGVKRDDTDAVVVADGTDMTHVSTGVYEYTFTEPADGLSYTAWVEIVYGGATYRFEHDIAASESAGGIVTSYGTLRRAIGRFLGYSRDPDEWEADQVTDIEDILRDGVLRFYFPPPLPGEKYSHQWSFFPWATTLSLTADDYDYDLPSDFHGLEGEFTFAPNDSVIYDPVKITSEHIVRTRLQDELTGRPQMAAIRTKEFDATSGSRWEVLFYPIPDDDYTLNYRYRVDPSVLDATNEYPYGGAMHSLTIQEACLAAAEATLNDGEGIHEKRFWQCLAASVSHDRMLACPDTLGYNHDRSDRAEARDWHDWDQNVVTYNDVTY